MSLLKESRSAGLTAYLQAMIWVVHWEAVPAYLGELQMVLGEAYLVLPFLQKDTVNPTCQWVYSNHIQHITQVII